MADVLTKAQRRFNMSRIGSKWTRPELVAHNFLKGYRIRHKMHPNLPGHPDILFPQTTTVVFLDGCFWHRCPRCFIQPTSNKLFWAKKIGRNVQVDRKYAAELQKEGYRVIRVWEHEFKNNSQRAVARILKLAGIKEKIRH